MGDKTRLKIEQLDKAGKVVSQPAAFQVLLNPASYQVSTEFCFSEESKLLTELPDTLELPALILDGTGVVPVAEGQPETVPQQLQKLRDVVSSTVPDQTGYRARPVVLVSWATLQFRGRVKKLDVDYTLFAPNGIPLRATVKLTFIGPDDVAADAGAASGPAAEPLRRQLEVKADTLPQLCFSAFDDPARDQAVARANALTSIRNLYAGLKLVL